MDQSPAAKKRTCNSSEVIFTVDDSELLALERLITLLHWSGGI